MPYRTLFSGLIYLVKRLQASRATTASPVWLWQTGLLFSLLMPSGAYAQVTPPAVLLHEQSPLAVVSLVDANIRTSKNLEGKAIAAPINVLSDARRTRNDDV